MRTKETPDERCGCEATRNGRVKKTFAAVGRQSTSDLQSQAGRLRGKVQWDGDLDASRIGRTPDA